LRIEKIERSLITLLLCARGVITEPILYLSLYFKRHQAGYYSLLDRVRTHGDGQAWLDFLSGWCGADAGRPRRCWYIGTCRERRFCLFMSRIPRFGTKERSRSDE